MEIPDDIATEIAGKREPDSSEDTTPKDEPKKDDQPKKEDEPKKDQPKDGEPEPKKGKAAKPKNGQSIAQVAAATEEDDDEEDDDGEEDPDGDDEPKKSKRGSLFKEFLGVKKELKESRQNYKEVSQALEELVDVVKSLKSNSGAQKDEIEEFAEEWGLNKEGTQKLVGILEKRLSTKFSQKKKDEPEKDEPKPKEVKKEVPKKSELSVRQVELAIESEYDDFVDSYPEVKSKINLKAIKSYILSDEENQQKSFSDIVNEMYPGALAKKASVDGAGDGIDRTDEDEEGIDWNDEKVQKRVQKDPKLGKQYHDDLINRAKNMFN